jgi:hypothetical protein
MVEMVHGARAANVQDVADQTAACAYRLDIVGCGAFNARRVPGAAHGAQAAGSDLAHAGHQPVPW